MWQRKGLGELGLSISTKLRMLATIVSAVDKKIADLNEELSDQPKVIRTGLINTS